MSESGNRLSRRGVQVGIFVGLVSAVSTIYHLAVDDKIVSAGKYVIVWAGNIFEREKDNTVNGSAFDVAKLDSGLTVTKYRITNSQYGSIAPGEPGSEQFHRGVTWGDATEFCAQLPGSETRLPTTKELNQAKQAKLTFDYSIGGEWTNDCSQSFVEKCGSRVVLDSSGSQSSFTGDRQLPDIGFRCVGLEE